VPKSTINNIDDIKNLLNSDCNEFINVNNEKEKWTRQELETINHVAFLANHRGKKIIEGCE